jgi:AraC family transcriptional regulator of adaptative response / DNA-3-methyladenine glycosylase II
VKVRTTLTAKPPFAGSQLFAFFAARMVPGIEVGDGQSYARTLRLPHGHGTVDVTVATDGCGVDVEIQLADRRDHAEALVRIRRLFDLDADAPAVDAHLGVDPVVGPLVRSAPGLRVAGSVDPFETAVRAIVGQQVSISGARTVAARLVAAAGEPLALGHEQLTTVFPLPETLAAAPDHAFAMPASRREAIRGLCRAVATGDVVLEHQADRRDVRRQLVALRGIGPWTAEYVAMRGLGDPDAFLPTDLGVRRALDNLGANGVDSDNWRPWRAYALHHLWNTAVT